jgi:hypothetical protein
MIKQIRPAAMAIKESLIPDYSNEKTNQTKREAGVFIYASDVKDRPSFRDVVKKLPYELDNNTIYIGEWSKDGLR